jgi:membrane-associated PAP2 superfamily phosphatase
LFLLAWDASGLDLVLAHWFGTAQGFALRDHWLFTTVLHEGARRLSWLLVVGLSLAVWWPVGVLRQLDRWQRLQLVVSILLGLALVVAIKRISSTSCPWDLAEFGGLARYVSHWRFGLVDGGGAHCFPAGHASAGFAFVGGYFVLRDRAPRAARIWLAAALTAGLVLGVSQQMRGAHFMSHTLWTAWLCWTVAWACHSLVTTWRLRSGEKRSSHVVA